MDGGAPGGLSPETEEILRRAREGERMPAPHKRRLKGAVLARLAFATTSLAAGQGAVSAAMSLGVVAKTVVGIAIVGSLGAGSYLALRPARHIAALTRHVAPPAPPAPPVAEPVQDEAPAAPARAVRAASAHPHRPIERHVALDDTATLAAETALLRDADRALRAGDRGTALARLDEHAARFPNGALAPERAAERLIVLCEVGAADPASVARFLAARSGSPLAARVRRACAPPR